MSTWVDQPSILSVEDVSVISGEVRVLEAEIRAEEDAIKQARARVVDLTAQLRKKRTLIAPVRKATFDILSSIFELCAEDDWTAPLTIGAVCRFWRRVVIHSPRAWRFVGMCEYPDECRQSCREIYIKRSGQCLLHAGVSTPSDMASLAKVAHRIEYLEARDLPPTLEGICFPILQHLDLTYNPFIEVNMPMLKISHFPNLRHLYLNGLVIQPQRCPELPPLQTLVVTVYDDNGRLGVIDDCSSTLTSLEITYQRICYQQANHYYDLPALRYLKVIDPDEDRGAWRTSFKTPNLRTYMDYCKSWSASPSLTQGYDSITHMRLMQIPPVMGSAQLLTLQLELSVEHLRCFFDGLNDCDPVYPRLEHLQFLHSGTASEKLEMMQILQGWDKRACPRLLSPPTIESCWEMCLPGEEQVQDGSDTHWEQSV